MMTPPHPPITMFPVTEMSTLSGMCLVLLIFVDCGNLFTGYQAHTHRDK